MNIDLVLAIALYLILILFYYKYKERFQVQGKVFILYRTKLGLKLMDSVARRFPRVLRFLGTISLLTGFFGMALMLGILIKVTKDLLFVPGAPPGLAPVLPGVPIPGMPALSFFHWIITILIVATVHEFMHGVYARLINVNIKSSGFAFLGPILAAFVEPDDKQLNKKEKKEQMLVYSAGPFANVLLAFILILVFGLSVPAIGLTHDITEHTAIIDLEKIANRTIEPSFNYISLSAIEEGSAAFNAGLKQGDKIIAVGNATIANNTKEFFDMLSSLKPGQKLKIATTEKVYELTAGISKDNSSKGYLGVMFKPEAKIIPKAEFVAKYGKYIAAIPLWFIMLINWIIIINVGIGLFNLLPLGPVDGGKMFYVLMLSVFRDNEKRAKIAFNIITIFCIALLVINLIPWIEKLLVFLFKPILTLIL